MKTLASLTLAASLLSLPAFAADKVSFKDPTGDDNGPGTYKYPTDAVYTKGSFDITHFDVEKTKSTDGKDQIQFTVGVNAKLENPWNMKGGFSTQMVFIFIDTDGKEGSGHTDAPPGLNIQFAPASAWDKLVIISPHESARVRTEVEAKAAKMKGDILIPDSVSGRQRDIIGAVDAASLKGDPSQWGYQVVMQSNEGFPKDNDLLTRKVNEYEGQHRFGGGNDGNCDPHVMDILAGNGKGDASEVKAQHDMLKYECGAEGASKSMATLTMVHAK